MILELKMELVTQAWQTQRKECVFNSQAQFPGKTTSTISTFNTCDVSLRHCPFTNKALS